MNKREERGKGCPGPTWGKLDEETKTELANTGLP